MGRLIGALTLLYTLAYTWAQEECKKGGCFPATGDLLVGRQHKLTATSTCGLNGAQQYCIVSFLDKNDKCFTCDSSNDRSSDTSYHPTSHLVKYVVSTSPKNRLLGWWQSGNGVQDVTIQLDLEVEFVFTHLIMTFKTFRPKAMYVERSWNYGREWSVYRYYAYDCSKSFPGISKGPQRNIDDVICEERYSRVEPSTEGEVVMKVLDPVIQRSEDPYSQRVQNLLKLTNLRIRFKELHTFGDDVLGDSPEVSRKYYYALYEMVVRGSCSCYGHAQRCISENGGAVIDNMVHGTCDCQHFTTGRNCEKCLPGYNDEPWRPAYKDQLSECRKCNCNEHTDKCHFDPAVYNATGHTSGGVCDDCQHNTAGRKCDHCKPLFYRDPFKDITDPDVCRPCDCDPAGSFGGGECETENVGVADAGRCICKQNVVGRRCDKCKDGFWNLLESNPQGCQSCKCDIRGTVERDTCDQKTGHCRCKRNVRGLTCSQCMDGYWNLGVTPKGCEECGCDPGGSRNFTCDDMSGQCSCRANLIGRKCDKVRPGYHFANLDHNTYEAENAVPAVSGTPFEVVRKIAAKDESVRWTGDGFLQVKQGSVITFPNVRVPETGDYNMVLRYDTMRAGDWTDVRMTVQKGNGGAMGGDGCPNDDNRAAYRYPIINSVNKGLHIDPSLCLQRGNNYKITLDFRHNNRPAQSATLLDSIVLLPKTDKLPIFDARNAEAAQRKQIYDEKNCRQYYVTANTAKDAPEACKKIQFSVSSLIHNGALSCQCHPVGTQSNGSNVLTCEEAGGQCPCKPGVTGRTCNKCAPGYFGFGGNGCTKCDCDSTGSKSAFCHHITGKCTCLKNIQGRKCDSCPPFHFGFPYCRSCDCNRHATSCNPKTGVCSKCDHNTAGQNCERCADGYYGNARRGTDTDCQRCQCPGGSSGNQFSSSCILDVRTGRGICNNCTTGYEGNQCERCADGFYGNPLIAGGSCKKCDCSGNIDLRAVGKCNRRTGKCYDCLNNSTGDNCESCKPKFFGNARNQTCRPCVCKDIGTDPSKGGICNAVTGQCPCLLNIEGKQCDRCAAGFFGLASGRGCLECNCKKQGSLEGSCDQTTGQCKCRVGFGGRDCGECEDLSWGSPLNKTCVRCGCNPKGSLDLQCDRRTGMCKCKPNVIGDKCDMCKPRTAGVMPRCESCHTCNAQWEDIAVELEKKINTMLNFTRNITNFNTSGIMLYNNEVKALRDQLRNMEPMFRQHKVSDGDIENFMAGLREFREKLGGVTSRVKEFGDVVKNTTKRTTDATKELQGIDLKMEELQRKAKEFKRNVTKMIEGNIGGAYNSTMESLRRSNAARESVDSSKKLIPQSKRKRKNMKREIINGAPTFDKLRQDNMDIADQIRVDLTDLENKLRELNKELCGANCGGCTDKSCTSCGAGPDCSGVKKMADNALKKAQEAQRAWEKKEISAKELVKTIQEVEVQVNKTKTATFKALGQTESAKQMGEVTAAKIIKLITDIKDFLDKKFNHPRVAKDLAQETLALNISLTPEQVRALADRIKKAVKDLKNVNKILKESEADLNDAMKLKEEALAAKKFAIEVMNKTQNILEKLAQTKDLQKAATTNVGATGKVVGKIAAVMRDMATKLQQAGTRVSEASANGARVRGETDNLKEKFRQNDRKLTDAENEYKRANSKVIDVENAKDVIGEKYNETNAKLKGNQQMLDDVLKRIATLNERAKKAVSDVNIKMTDLTELTKKYKLNEKKTEDLSLKIKQVTIQAKFNRDRLRELSKCHATCNPAISTPICVDELKQVQIEEDREKAKYRFS